MHGYHSTIVVYRRSGNRVTAIRYRKEWVPVGTERVFTTTRSAIVPVDSLTRDEVTAANGAPIAWTSKRVDSKPITRADFLADATICEAGYGWPHGCLTLKV